MARARNIKPRFLTNELLGECLPEARLLFLGLVFSCDREGRLEYRPKRLGSELLPYDDVDVEKLLGQLARVDLIRIYINPDFDIPTIWLPKFLEHNRCHPAEAASKLPKCPDDYPEHLAGIELNIARFKSGNLPHLNLAKDLPSYLLPLASCLLPSFVPPLSSPKASPVAVAPVDRLGTPDLVSFPSKKISDSPLKCIDPGSADSGKSKTPKTKKPKPAKFDPKTQTPVPPELQQVEFMNAWNEWCDCMAERKPRLTKRAAGMQMKKLAAIGPVAAIACIESSIANNYQGLFPDKFTGKKGHAATDDELRDFVNNDNRRNGKGIFDL